MRLNPVQALLVAVLCALAVWATVVWFVGWTWFT